MGSASNYSSKSKRQVGLKRRSKQTASSNAIAVLKADHRQVEKWFRDFKSARSTDKKQKLASQICKALRVHTAIEEEIFYPAFILATKDRDIHHEAIIEHAGAKTLIGQIEESSALDDYFDAKVSVLSEMIKHHVREEEQPGGMFAKAKQSKLDLDALGANLRKRKEELSGDAPT